jgi:quinol monooxygenase YgiN
LFAEFTALPGKREEVAALLRVLAHRVREEPGNVLFEASSRADSPDSFFVYEEYRDAAAFDAHIGAEYGAQFNTALNPLIAEDHSRLTWLERI